MNKINKEKIIKQTETAVVLEFSIPGSSDYFNGHFPGFPVLPAVAQIFIITHFVSRYFGICIELSKIKRTKFINIIQPDIPLVLYLEKIEKNISFKIISTDEKTVFSAGTLVLPEEL
ncbi:MAG: hydroxymyristoyl-ACP dehydratase [Treponema sp.]|nr:hydroxymyristoyl-ACP dehydratase [Treponema sp.]